MAKQSNISLIAAAALFGVAMISIAGAASGRISFNDQPDAMVTQLYTPSFAAGDQHDGMLASNVMPSGAQVQR